MRADCVKSGNVGETKLAECRLENCNSGRFVDIRSGGTVDSFDNLIDVR